MPNKKTVKSVKAMKAKRAASRLQSRTGSSLKTPIGRIMKAPSVTSIEETPLGSGHMSGIPDDMEGLLLGWFSSMGNSQASPRLLLHDSFFCSTAALSEFSSSYGFHIGERAFSISEGRGVTMLFNMLESSGLGKLLYLPSTDRVIIRSVASSNTKSSVGFNLHSYEAGIISGFLSSHTSMKIITTEVSCMYNGSDICQFVSTVSGESIGSGKFKKPNWDTRFLSESIKISEIQNHTGGETKFILLGMLPFITDSPMESASKLMFLAGRETALDFMDNYQDGMRRMASFLCAEIADIGRKGKKMEFSVFYGNEVASRGFMELGTKAFIGFLSKHFNSSVTLSKRKTKKGYVIAIAFEGV